MSVIHSEFMATPEILAKLCASTTRFTYAGGTYSSDRLSRSELAGLLAKLSQVQVDHAMAKYAWDEISETKLIFELSTWAIELAKHREWQVRDPSIVINMATIACLEACRPNRHKACRGRGFVRGKPCVVCNGTGIKYLSGRQIAGCIGVDSASYRRLWCRRYEIIARHLQGIDYQIKLTLKQNDRD